MCSSRSDLGGNEDEAFYLYIDNTSIATKRTYSIAMQRTHSITYHEEGKEDG